jgi:hypothetical protein
MLNKLTEINLNADDNAPTNIDDTEYLAAVKEGKDIVADLSGKQWALGDLAARVEKSYGENRLKRFAEDINFPGSFCTLGRYRTVCLAFPKTGVRPRFFASAQILQKHGDRIAIVERDPAISKAEARELMRGWRAEQKGTASPAAEAVDEVDDDGTDDDLEEAADDLEAMDTSATAEPTAPPTSTPARARGTKAKGTKKPVNEEQAEFNESKRLLSMQLKLANDMIGAAEARKKCPPEQRRNLGKAAAALPASLATMRQAGAAWLEYVDFLEKLAAEAKETAIGEGRIRNSPKPAASSEPAQVSA